MTPENSDLMVHDMIGRLFDEPEPLHRADLADGAIAHGMAVSRRRGFGVAGATLSVLAVVAGAVAVAGGSGGPGKNDWSLGLDSTTKISPQAYEDSGPTYADKQRELVERLPALVGTLFGATVSADQRETGAATYVLTGDFVPTVEVNFGGSKDVVSFDGIDDNGYARAFAGASATPVAVTGGTVRIAVVPLTGEGEKDKFTAYYEFVPTDKAKPTIHFRLSGDGKISPFDATAFKKMAAGQTFAELRTLLDPSVPASQAFVQQRYRTEAKINAEAAKVLPAGFRLKLNPGVPGGLELVGPEGVNTFQWDALPGAKDQIACPAASLCYVPTSGQPIKKVVGPDGKARLGVYAGWTGTAKDNSIVLSVFGKAKPGMDVDPVQMGKATETAPQGPGLTPQQAMAIIKAPGASQVITDVLKLAAVYPQP